MRRSRMPRPPRKSRRVARSRLRYNPAEEAGELDLSGSEEATVVKKGKSERRKADSVAARPLNLDQEKCPVPDVAAVIIPVNSTLLSWAQAEAEAVRGSGIDPDKLGRLLVLAAASREMPTHDPGMWESKSIPHVEVSGESKRVFLESCSPETNLNTPVYLVQVSSAQAPTGSLMGSLMNVDFNSDFGLRKFVLEKAVRNNAFGVQKKAFGVQVLLPEDYLQERNKEEVPTFFSADFFKELSDRIMEQGRFSSELNALRGKVIKAAKAAVKHRSINPNKVRAAEEFMLSTCLVRLGPLLGANCYFPQVWTHKDMPLVPESRFRAITNVVSRVLMAQHVAGTDDKRHYRDAMANRSKAEARKIKTYDDMVAWVQRQNIPSEMKARLLFNHTIVVKGRVLAGGEIVDFEAGDGSSFDALDTDGVADWIRSQKGVEVSETENLFIGWSSSPEKILITPVIQGVPRSALLGGVTEVPDKNGELLSGARTGRFEANARTKLAMVVKDEQTKLIAFATDPETTFVVTGISRDNREATFTAKPLPEAVSRITQLVVSGEPEIAPIFSDLSLATSVISVGDQISPKDYNKLSREIAGRLDYLAREKSFVQLPSLRIENRDLAGPVLRMEAFPDPRASDSEIEEDLVPMVAAVRKFPTLRDAADAPSLGAEVAKLMRQRMAALGVDERKSPSTTIPPLNLYAVAFKKPLRGAPRGASLGSDRDPKTLYILTAAGAELKKPKAGTLMYLLPITDHHRSFLHKAFVARVEYLPSGKIDFEPLGGGNLSGSLLTTPFIDPESYRRNQSVQRIYEKLKEKAEAKENPEGDAPEGPMKFGTARGPEYVGGLTDEQKLWRQAVNTYLQRMMEFAPSSPELRSRQQRAALSDAAIRQAAYSGAGGFMAKASQTANRWGVPATKRSAPIGWEANVYGIMRSNELLLPSDEADFIREEAREGDLTENNSLLRAAFVAYGVELPEKMTRTALLDKLNELRQKVQRSKVETFDREELEFTPAPRFVGRRDQESGYGAEEATEDDLIARLNPENEEYASYLAEQLAGTGDARSVPDATLDFGGTRGAFPLIYRRKEMTQPASYAERIATQGKFVQFPKRGAVEDFAFTEYETRLGPQAGFSVPETRAMIKRLSDSYGRRLKTTIPASSAVCATNRTKRLQGYRFPRSVMDAGPPGFQRKKVVIWVSPPDSGSDRVMTYRRNTHIDCDIKFGGARSLGQAMAIALQDTLLWLAQKDGRQRDTFVYVGRVGDSKLNLAWKPGDPLSFEKMLQNLDNDSGSIEVNVEGDEKKYRRAASGSIVQVEQEVAEKVQKAKAPEAPTQTDEVPEDEEEEVSVEDMFS